MPLLAQVLQRCRQRGARNLDQAIQRLVQLEDEEDRRRDRAGAHEEDRHGRDVGWRVQPEADEQKTEPEDQDEEKRERKLVLRLFDQEPVGLAEIAHDLLGLREDLPLSLVLGLELAQLGPHELHGIGALDGAQGRHTTELLLRPGHFDACRDAALQLFAGRPRLGPVVREGAIQDDDLRAALHDRAIGGVELALRGTDQQTEHHRGERGDRAGAEFYHVLRFLGEVVFWQDAL